jgi:LysM repeat protein
MVFAAVLVALAIGLFFLLNWILGAGGPLGASTPPTPAPSPAPGQLPPPAPISSPPPFVVPSPSPSPPPGAAPQGRVHQVQAGDTLNRIAQNYGVTVDAIMQANGRTDRNQILRIGERLVIPDAPAGGTAPR